MREFFALESDYDDPDFNPTNMVTWAVGATQATLAILLDDNRVQYTYYSNELAAAAQQLDAIMAFLTDPPEAYTAEFLPLAFEEECLPSTISVAVSHDHKTITLTDGISSITVFDASINASIVEALKTFQTQLKLQWS